MPHLIPSIYGLSTTLEEAQGTSTIQKFFQQVKFRSKLNDIYLMSQLHLKEGLL